MSDGQPVMDPTTAAIQWLDEVSPGDLAKVVAVARQLVALRPGQAEHRLRLAEALRKNGQLDQALSHLAEALLQFPDAAGLRFCQATALEEAGSVRLALESLDRLLDTAPDHRRAQIMRSRLRVKSSPTGQSRHALEGVEAVVGPGLDLTRLQLQALFKDGCLSELVSQCERAPTRCSGDTAITYLHAVALAKLNRVEAARRLIALDRSIDVAMLPLPAGFASEAEFCETIAIEIRRNPAFMPDPKGKATRHGFLTWHIRNIESPAVEALLAEIRNRVDDYVLRLGNASHCFVKARPRAARLTAWAVRTDADGHQISHHHPGGWLSGVFYVEAPRSTGERRFSGPLVLGAVEEGIEPPWGTLEVEPVPGRIALFPSYLPHATLPSNAAGSRIVVAFDVVPVQTAEQRSDEHVI